MLVRLLISLALAMSIAFAGFGCGSDDGSESTTGGSSASQAPAETQTDGDRSTGAQGDSTAPSTPATGSEPLTREQAVDSCEAGVERSQVSGARKQELRDFCSALASGDDDRVRDAARGVCERLIDDRVEDREALIDKCADSAAAREFEE
jgi:hypothetical protein